MRPAEPTVRAVRAYLRGGGTDQPSRPDAASYAGKEYVVLRNVRGILAIYRVRKDSSLRRLRRWPAALDEL